MTSISFVGRGITNGGQGGKLPPLDTQKWEGREKRGGRKERERREKRRERKEKENIKRKRIGGERVKEMREKGKNCMKMAACTRCVVASLPVFKNNLGKILRKNWLKLMSI